MQKAPAHLKLQQGFTLLEIMVAFALASFAVLGLAVTQTKSLQYGYSSYQYTLASIQASNTIETIWDSLSDLQCGTDTLLNVTPDSDITSGFTRTFYDANGTTVITSYADEMTIVISWTDDRQDTGDNSAEMKVIFPKAFYSDCTTSSESA